MTGSFNIVYTLSQWDVDDEGERKLYQRKDQHICQWYKLHKILLFSKRNSAYSSMAPQPIQIGHPFYGANKSNKKYIYL